MCPFLKKKITYNHSHLNNTRSDFTFSRIVLALLLWGLGSAQDPSGCWPLQFPLTNGKNRSTELLQYSMLNNGFIGFCAL